jgi:hypothetical protein
VVAAWSAGWSGRWLGRLLVRAGDFSLVGGVLLFCLFVCCCCCLVRFGFGVWCVCGCVFGDASRVMGVGKCWFDGWHVRRAGGRRGRQTTFEGWMSVWDVQ